MEECYSCKSLSGETRISPGPAIYEGEYWVVEHAYPCGLEGWLVLVQKRHASALHELTEAEFSELAGLQLRTVRVLREVFNCEKEYSVCFAEAEHFKQVHFHMIPRSRDLAVEQSGTGIFSFLKVDESRAVPPERVEELCLQLRERF